MSLTRTVSLAALMALAMSVSGCSTIRGAVDRINPFDGGDEEDSQPVAAQGQRIPLIAAGGPRGSGRQKGVTLGASINNLTNRANSSGFSGVMTSQYFLQPTNVANPRQVDISLRFNF